MAWHIFGVLQVAISVKVVQLEELTVNRLKSICSTDNIYNVLNDAANLGLECIPAHCLLQLKMITPNSGLLTVNSGCSALFTSRTKGITLKHAIGGDNENVSIDLKRISTLNYLEMELAEGDWSYWIAVSTDNVEWTRIIDYSDFICRSVQRLFFKERQVRYIRICGTAPANGIFEILRLKTYRSTELFEVDTQTGIVIPSENVALTKKNAVVIQGENEFGGMLNATASTSALTKLIGREYLAKKRNKSGDTLILISNL
uniref:F5/8 type C domain-containing protein n=1 Tax=Panagrellus redivivus TaxID=6233 RepID=A0A7E4VL73_PANRE